MTRWLIQQIFNCWKGLLWSLQCEIGIGRRNDKQGCFMFNPNCLTVGAVHSEVVPKFHKNYCFIAIMLFPAQKGKPSTIISDNWTSLIGAEREFAEYVAL